MQITWQGTLAKSTDLQNWQKIAQNWWSKGNKKTFSHPAGLSGTFSILGPDFYFYTGLIRSFSCLRPALLLFLGIMSTFSILFGSGTRFFSSETRFLLLSESNTLFFLSQTRLLIFFALCQPFPILNGSGLHIFYSGT